MLILSQSFIVLLFIFCCCSTDGVVVCQEFEQVLLDAWREEEELAEKRRAEVLAKSLQSSSLLALCHFCSVKLTRGLKQVPKSTLAFPSKWRMIFNYFFSTARNSSK